MAGTVFNSPVTTTYAERIFRRRRSWFGRRNPKPIAKAIGIAIKTRVSVEVVEISPTRIPRVNVVGLPFAILAVTTIRCVPDLVPAGNRYVPLTVPSAPTTVENRIILCLLFLSNKKFKCAKIHNFPEI